MVNFGERDVQQLLKESLLLVTDFSSVYFDFAYMHKPVIYFQFDEDAFYDEHYHKGYFDYRRDGFGDVCLNVTSVVKSITEVFINQFNMDKKYLDRTTRFFTLDKKLAKLDIEINEEKISAITLDKELYRFALKHRKNYDGLIFLDREALIVLKVIAYYNNLRPYNDGHKVDKEEYTKHRKDVITTLSSYNERSLSSIDYPPDYRDQIVSFVDILAGKEVKQICSQMGLDPQVVVSYYKKPMSI